MQAQIGMRVCAQLRPFSLRLLNAILTENTLACLDDRFDICRRKRLGHGHQLTLSGARPALGTFKAASMTARYPSTADCRS